MLLVLDMNKKTIFQESIDLQLKAKEIGLDWLEVNGVVNKLYEEANEVVEAIASGDKLTIKEELGDLFFTLLCLSRHLEQCPEEILTLANKKFESRYTKVLNHLSKTGKSYADPEEMEKIWQIIKKQT